jgi:hypothetical protein
MVDVVVDVVGDVEVLVDVSCANAAAAGTNDAVTNAPTSSARLRGMTLYRREKPDC